MNVIVVVMNIIFPQKLSNDEYEYFINEKNVGFPQHTAVDKEVREASTQGDKVLSELDVELR